MGRKPTILYLLMTRFWEMKGSVDFERTEKGFRYTKENMGLIFGKRQGSGRRIY